MSRLASREARRLALLAVLAIAAAYQVQRPILIPADDEFLGALALRDFYGPEGDFRWSRDHSAVLFPDPGPGLDVRLEITLAGWRPRAEAPPLVDLSAGNGGLLARPNPRGETLAFTLRTAGTWRSDLVLAIQSATFQPGRQDPRSLGVRFYQARLVPTGGAALHRPPLRPLVLVPLAALLGFVALVRLGASPRAALLTGTVAALISGAGYAFARAHASLLTLPFLGAMALFAAFTHLLPRAAGLLAEVAAESGRRVLGAIRSFGTVRPALLVAGGSIGLAAAYAAHPRLEIDVGSGRETVLASRFGAFDSSEGASFRTALPGSTLDLRDFGAGHWSVAVTSAAGNGGWETTYFEAESRFAWRPGLKIPFRDASGGAPVRIDRVVVERGGVLASPRVVLALLAAAFLAGVGVVAAGLRAATGTLTVVMLLAAEGAALAADPLIVVPFALPFLGIAGAGALLMAVAGGVAAVAGRRGAPLFLPPSVLATAALGFVAWFAASAFPLYRGGNFLFHSNIAEEIWKGYFLLYYLPYPGSMLSRQAQWGDVVVPHPCLYQVLAAPLAALPREWFHLAEKAGLALGLAGLVVVAGLLAQRAAGERAAAFAAIVMAGLVPSFQLLGLGHLMTILGCVASSIALGFLVSRAERLTESSTWWIAVSLLTFCFLSYTAALLFSGLVLVLALPVLIYRGPRVGRALLTVTLAAGALAFLLYYVNWAGPFLVQTVPKLLHGSGVSAADAGVPVWSRLLRQPAKLNYSYGSFLVPLGGLAGLGLLPRSPGRLVLLAWGAVLVVVSGLDLFFNFLLKHHYYVMVPVAVGLGLLLARAWEAGRLGRLLCVAVLAVLLALGADTALAVALGDIP
jgi:hypothetical protein